VALACGTEHNLALRGDGTVVAWGGRGSGRTNVPSGLSNVVAIAAGRDHSLALRLDGTVAAWGSGAATNVPSGLSNVVAIAGGLAHSLALRADGSVVTWGCCTVQTNLPAGLTNAIAIAGGGFHSLALLGNGPPPPLINPAPALVQPRLRGDQFSVFVSTVIGRVYGFEFKNALSDAYWHPLSLTVGDGTVKVLHDPNAAVSQRFYRIRQWQ
jgi:hypothetical protein